MSSEQEPLTRQLPTEEKAKESMVGFDLEFDIFYDCTFSESNAKELALKRFSAVYSPGEERLVSASDDFTLFMWLPEKEKKPAGNLHKKYFVQTNLTLFISARLVGHQQLVNDVRFSPDTRILASASFDKSIRLWDGRTGKYVGRFCCIFYY